MATRTLRVACVQLSPVFKNVPASIARADALIRPIEPWSIDLLVLPEMAFAGYCFTSREDIELFLENSASGITHQWASEVAARLICYVMVGVPTRSSASNASNTSAGSSTSTAESAAFNSVLLLDPSGALLHTYHKHQLYETDISWATEGPAFQVWNGLPFPSSSSSAAGETFSICPAICMDINPNRFTAPFEAFEFASFARENRPDLVVCCMAWLDSEPLPIAEEAEEKQGGPEEEWEKVQSTISYWALRCRPLTGCGIPFVGCNRVGREGDDVFTGSSCVILLDETPEVLDHAPKRGEALLRVDVPLRPRG